MAQPPKSYTRPAMAIIVGILVIAAALLASAYLSLGANHAGSSASTIATGPCGQQIGNSTSVSITDCQLDITLTLGIKDEVLPTGVNETFYVSVRNDVRSNRTLSLTSGALPLGISASNPAPDTEILPAFQCGQISWIVVYNQSGLPVQLNDAAPSFAICGTTSAGVIYQFSAYQTVSQTLAAGGYWQSSNATAPWVDATLSQFAPGQYTVVAFDGWSQQIGLKFTVEASASSSTSSAESITGTPPSASDAYLTACTVTGIGGFELRVVSDSTSTPVSGETINAVDKLGCTSETQTVYIDDFSVGTGGWLTPVWPPQAQPGGQLTFTVTYQGTTYTFSEQVPPVGTLCATLHLPSGNVTTGTVMNGSGSYCF